MEREHTELTQSQFQSEMFKAVEALKARLDQVNHELRKMTDQTLMTVNEAAAYCKIQPGTLYQYSSGDKGPKITRIGRAVRYRRSDLDAWIAQGGKQ